MPKPGPNPKLTPAEAGRRVVKADEALRLLRTARDILEECGHPNTRARVDAAISSAKGAVRIAEQRLTRATRLEPYLVVVGEPGAPPGVTTTYRFHAEDEEHARELGAQEGVIWAVWREADAPVTLARPAIEEKLEGAFGPWEWGADEADDLGTLAIMVQDYLVQELDNRHLGNAEGPDGFTVAFRVSVDVVAEAGVLGIGVKAGNEWDQRKPLQREETMGLDMYLKAKLYVFGYRHNKPQERERYRAVLEAVGMTAAHQDGSPSAEVFVTVAYWRKANAIHAWFVEKVQNGEDDCGSYYVGRQQLEELRDTCRKVLEVAKVADGQPVVNGYEMKGGDKDWKPIIEMGRAALNGEELAAILPTKSGFFFGPTEYDQFYLQDMEETVQQIERALAAVPDSLASFYYESSW